MATIKNIVFDFGNVLFDIDIPKIEENLLKHFDERAGQAWAQIEKQQLFTRYEVGGIDTPTFVERVRTAGGLPYLSAEQVIQSWNSIFVDFPRKRLDFLLTLREEYKVFMLSNINELHENWIEDHVQQTLGIQDYRHKYFDKVYMSHLIHLRKPDPDIYAYLLADAGIDPRESIFFDDLLPNVTAANAAGIQGIWHPPGTEIIEHCQRVLENNRTSVHKE
jgi:glucose-1-phosphatase